jgi:hypothetical protein
MGFHHTLFVRQSIENVEELNKYMYSRGTAVLTPSLTASRSDATSSQAYIASEAGTPAPPLLRSREPTEQGTCGSGAFLNAARSYAPTAQGADAAGVKAIPPPSQQGGANTPQNQSPATRSTSAHTHPSLTGNLRSRGVAGVPSCFDAVGVREGAYDRLRGQAVSLFWAIYIAIHGYEEYAQIGRGYSNFEINEKQKIVATIQKSPTILKQTNQKMTKDKIKEVMSEVMSGKNMGLSTLPAFATVYNKRIIVVMKNTMRIDISAEGAEDTIVIRKNNKDGGNLRFPSQPSLPRAGGCRGAAAPCCGMFVPDLDANVGIIERETHCFHQIDKPLRPVSTYKLDELVGIAGLLEVPYENKKKPELYVDLVQKCI